MKNIIKIVSAILSLVIIGISVYAIYNVIQSNKANEPNIETLATPVISYNEESCILSWNEVENATSYVVSINGQENTVETTSTKVDINAKTTEMKVKAKSDQGYNDSEWSKSYTYTVSAEDTQKNLRIVISDFLGETAQLKEIMSVHIWEGNTIYVNAITEENGVAHLNRVSLIYDDSVTSLKNALSESNLSNATINSSENVETVEYDTLSEIIKQKKYGTKIKNLVDQGYEISVVNSATQKYDSSDSDAMYYTYGLLKLTKGNETKYLDVSYQVITQKQLYQYSYIDYIGDDTKTTIRVAYATELTGDAYDFAKELDQEV